jgi:tetraacyldisaccharide 4'-kinase
MKERRQHLLPWWEEILRGHTKGLLPESIRRFAKLGSWGYEVGMKGRELAYRHGLLQVQRLPLPTICVGNITVGGTGKTPLVMRLTQDLLDSGLRPAVLLRGYKREKKHRKTVLVRDAAHMLATVAEAGDEAMELAHRLPGACVGVGADRYRTGNFILKNHSVDCFVMDDGFQHHRLQRDINIVAVDVTDPWGGGKLLPAGLLREPPAALKRADAVVLTRTGSVGPDRLSVLKAEVMSHMAARSVLLESRHEGRYLTALQNKKQHSLGELRGRKVIAVSAIGNPRAFENMLADLGADLVGALHLADHSGRAEDVRHWINRNRRQAEWIVMTEKDAMRWGTAGSLPLPALALRMDLVFTEGEEHWMKLVKLVRKLAHA